MKLIDLQPGAGNPVTQFESVGVSSVKGAEGSGGGHIYYLRFEPGGRIGRHPAGPAQLFVVVDGSGWVEGDDGVRKTIHAGEAAYIVSGEEHAKGSESGMSAVMVQLDQLTPVAQERAD